MKKIVVSYYLLLFGASGNRQASYYASLLIVSALTVITLGGFFSLIKAIAPTEQLADLFTLPRCFIPGVAFLLFYAFVAPPSRMPSKDTARRPSVSTIVVTISIALVLFLYSAFSDKFLN